MLALQFVANGSSALLPAHPLSITYIHTYIRGGAQGTQGSSKNCTSRESVSPLSRLIRGFCNKYH